MLAVLKSGAAFVLLDANNSLRRKQSIGTTVKAKVLLCSAILPASVSFLAGTVATVDDGKGELWPRAGLVSSVSVTSTNAAYVVLTSRLTGLPNGVENGTSTQAESPLTIGHEQFLSQAKAAQSTLSKTLPDYIQDKSPETTRGGAIISKEELDSYSRHIPPPSMREDRANLEEWDNQWGVAGLVGEILGIPATKLHPGNNSFHIGADSIKTMQLAMAVRAQGLVLTMPPHQSSNA
ncbi:hypothetical protein FQN49_004151 [Arthroderma sp. PD_2]|nr:hypothetical protein FQN49_004151 [Arthroderma sp. PD_2]